MSICFILFGTVAIDVLVLAQQMQAIFSINWARHKRALPHMPISSVQTLWVKARRA